MSEKIDVDAVLAYLDAQTKSFHEEDAATLIRVLRAEVEAWRSDVVVGVAGANSDDVFDKIREARAVTDAAMKGAGNG